MEEGEAWVKERVLQLWSRSSRVAQPLILVLRPLLTTWKLVFRATYSAVKAASVSTAATVGEQLHLRQNWEAFRRTPLFQHIAMIVQAFGKLLDGLRAVATSIFSLTCLFVQLLGHVVNFFASLLFSLLRMAGAPQLLSKSLRSSFRGLVNFWARAYHGVTDTNAAAVKPLLNRDEKDADAAAVVLVAYHSRSGIDALYVKSLLDAEMEISRGWFAAPLVAPILRLLGFAASTHHSRDARASGEAAEDLARRAASSFPRPTLVLPGGFEEAMAPQDHSYRTAWPPPAAPREGPRSRAGKAAPALPGGGAAPVFAQLAVASAAAAAAAGKERGPSRPQSAAAMGAGGRRWPLARRVVAVPCFVDGGEALTWRAEPLAELAAGLARVAARSCRGALRSLGLGHGRCEAVARVVAAPLALLAWGPLPVLLPRPLVVRYGAPLSPREGEAAEDFAARVREALDGLMEDAVRGGAPKAAPESAFQALSPPPKARRRKRD